LAISCSHYFSFPFKNCFVLSPWIVEWTRRRIDSSACGPATKENKTSTCQYSHGDMVKVNNFSSK
jgi:hypothetical protein